MYQFLLLYLFIFIRRVLDHFCLQGNDKWEGSPQFRKMFNDLFFCLLLVMLARPLCETDIGDLIEMVKRGSPGYFRYPCGPVHVGY